MLRLSSKKRADEKHRTCLYPIQTIRNRERRVYAHELNQPLPFPPSHISEKLVKLVIGVLVDCLINLIARKKTRIIKVAMVYYKVPGMY